MGSNEQGPCDMCGFHHVTPGTPCSPHMLGNAIRALRAEFREFRERAEEIQREWESCCERERARWADIKELRAEVAELRGRLDIHAEIEVGVWPNGKASPDEVAPGVYPGSNPGTSNGMVVTIGLNHFGALAAVARAAGVSALHYRDCHSRELHAALDRLQEVEGGG